jgi:hypothetical protein
MNVFGRDIPFTFDKGKLVVEFAIPKEMQEQIVKKLKEVIPEIKDVTFEEMKEKKDKATTQQ